MLRPDDPETHDERIGKVERTVVLDAPRYWVSFLLPFDAALPDRQPSVAPVTPLPALPFDLLQRDPYRIHEPLDARHDPLAVDLDVRVLAHERLDDQLLLKAEQHLFLVFVVRRRSRGGELEVRALELEELDTERGQQRVGRVATLNAVRAASAGEQESLGFERRVRGEGRDDGARVRGGGGEVQCEGERGEQRGGWGQWCFLDKREVRCSGD